MKYQLVRSNSLTSEHAVLGTYDELREIRQQWPNYWNGWDLTLQDIPALERDNWDIYVVMIDENGSRKELEDTRPFEEDI